MDKKKATVNTNNRSVKINDFHIFPMFCNRVGSDSFGIVGDRLAMVNPLDNICDSHTVYTVKVCVQAFDSITFFSSTSQITNHAFCFNLHCGILGLELKKTGILITTLMEKLFNYLLKHRITIST